VPRRLFLIFTAIYIFVCLVYLFWMFSVTEPGYPLDDAWIHQVFARNLAQGHGFSFNPGQPVAGVTAPLWTLLMALLWPIAGPIASGIILGVLLEWLALIAVFKIALFLTNDEKLSTYLLLICVTFWAFIWGALSGMEVGLYSALSLWGLYIYLKAESVYDKRNYLAYLLLTLAVLARPECGVFLAGAIIHDMYAWIRLPNKSIWPWVGRALIVLAIIMPYFVFNYATTGTIVPQTYTAKTQGKGLISSFLHDDYRRVFKSLTIYPYTYFHDFLSMMTVFSPFLMASFVAGALKLTSLRDSLRSKRVMLISILLFYVPLMGTFSPVFAMSTYHRLRLLDNILPLVFLVGLTGLFWRPRESGKPLQKWLLISGLTISIVGGIMILTDKFIVQATAWFMVQDYSRFTPTDILVIARIVNYLGHYTIILGFLLVTGAFISGKTIQALLNSRPAKTSILMAIFIYSAFWLIYKSDHYANDVKNINEVDKAIGLYLREMGGGSVAVNDIGAIGYYSGMKVLDLMGLVSPQITPDMVNNDSLTFEYMYDRDRVDYLAIFLDWFRYIPTRTDILKPIKTFAVERNTILGADTTIVYKAEWPDTNQNALQRPR